MGKFIFAFMSVSFGLVIVVCTFSTCQHPDLKRCSEQVCACVCVLRLLYDVGWRHAVLCAYGKLILVTSFFKGACVCLCMYVCM